MNKKQLWRIKIIAWAILAGFVMGWFWGAFYTQYSIQQQETSTCGMEDWNPDICPKYIQEQPAVDSCLCYLGEDNQSIIMEHGGEHG
jgi:hypothetical protein